MTTVIYANYITNFNIIVYQMFVMDVHLINAIAAKTDLPSVRFSHTIY